MIISIGKHAFPFRATRQLCLRDEYFRAFIAVRNYLRLSHFAEFVPGSPATSPETYDYERELAEARPEWSFKFRVFKTGFDYGTALLALPIIGVFCLVLQLLNPFLNPGPLFFRQKRTGRLGREFTMWKFRTMLPAASAVRDPDAPLEVNRITRLGRLLRRTRLDELPNFFNVLRGEMSVVGPRPDAANHADFFSESIHGYANRHMVKPGITGLAQVEHGYAEGRNATERKAKYDNLYVLRSCGRLDLYIVFRTVFVIFRGFGAK